MGKTAVSISGDRFYINGRPTYEGCQWNSIRIEGLLMNTRMVQAIFDDQNPDSVTRWIYPDTGRWDPERNVSEFILAMPTWRDHGVLCFTMNLQGGSPEGYSKGQPWVNSAVLPDGSLDPAYMARADRVISAADDLGMVVILGLFYFGQSKVLNDEAAVENGVRNATSWILDHGYSNVIVEINNECNINDHRAYASLGYRQVNLQKNNVAGLIGLVQRLSSDSPLLVGTSFTGGAIPTDSVLDASDVILVHGNGVEESEQIEEMIKIVRSSAHYRGQPIVFNEDDHFRFDENDNNMLRALRNGASWGYFDPGENNYQDGYQCPPVNWGVNTPRKQAFFAKVKEITSC